MSYEKMDDLKLFDKVALGCSTLTACKYSTSFTMGIKLLDEKYREPICAIYGFLRYADEIVDTFLHKDRKLLLEKFKRDTYDALDAQVSFNPILHAFQLIANKFNIDRKLVDAFFVSMEMDLSFTTYNREEYCTYIYGSAEIVGLMCLRVFCENDDELYVECERTARKLGAALQKVNFLRDMVSDFEKRGRIYFPDIQNFGQFDEDAKKRIERDIQADFDEAYTGIRRLPDGAQSGVETTFFLYNKLFEKMKNMSAEDILYSGKRIRINKLLLLTSKKFLYFWLNTATILSVLLTAPITNTFLGMDYSKCAILLANVVTAIFFIYWDIHFDRKKIWKFNPKYTIGLKMFSLPVEEVAFFIVVPYACVHIYILFSNFFILQNYACMSALSSFFFCAFILSSIFMGIHYYHAPYTFINAVFAFWALVLHYYLFGLDLFGCFLIALIIHYIPFFIFNGILSGGSSLTNNEPVVSYDKKAIINFRIGTIPVEDIFYSMSLFLLNVTLFEYIQNIFA